MLTIAAYRTNVIILNYLNSKSIREALPCPDETGLGGRGRSVIS